MSSVGANDDFTIMRLRVNGTNLDPLAIRPRVQNLIRDIRLYPLLPESASLLIRKLDDPSPGLLRLEAIESRATQTWRQSFQKRFEQLATTAARPARGSVSSSVESVLFLDYSELLACLTADWCNGFVGARWWWHSFLQRGDIEQVVKRYWREKIEYAPAALQQLASKTHVLVEFVESLSDVECCELIERVVQKFALAPALKRVIRSFQGEVVDERREQFAEVPVSSSRPVVREVRSVVAPWRFVVAESDTPRLRPVQQLFLGVALMIRRAPAEVRTERFVREVERWQESIFAAPSVKEVVRVVGEFEMVEVVSEEINNTAQTDQERIEVVVIEGAREEPTRVVGAESVQEIVVAEMATPRVVESVMAEALDELPVVEAPQTIDAAPRRVVVEIEDSFTIETELGGLFYLINLAIFLEIYSDFTSPVETFTELNIWDFVAIVGSELNEYEDCEDPIWALLAELAGREEVFLRKGANAQRSDLRLPEVFRCAFAPLREETFIQDIRARLRLALNTDDFRKILLHHHARITLTLTHIDVFFSLSQLPIEIRLSGLDRDPGWVPAAARFIAFHFE